jgi:predicted PurR-regulated permease PerM
MSKPDIRKRTATDESDWGSRSHVHTLLLMAATVAGIYICYLLFAPFIPVFTWALAFAVLFSPLFRRLEKRIKRPNLTATICVLAAALIVLVPATLLAQRILGEAANGVGTIKTMIESGEWNRMLDAHPRIAPAEHWIEKQVDLPGIINSVASWLSGAAASLVNGSVMQLTGIVLTFYMLFYLLRDHVAILDAFCALSPLSRPDMNRIFTGVSDTVYATVYGTFAVALVQGALGGLMFWWLDLPSPFIWGVVMALLAVVPVLGAFIIWIPAAIFLLLEGSEGKALLLTIWGAVVVGGIDNLLYPMLVGSRLKMHTVLAFVTIVGGLMVFGASGFILGPVIFTVTRILLEVWRSQNMAELEADMAG